MGDEPDSNVKRFCRIPRILREGGVECPQESAPACSFCGRPLSEVRYLVGSGAARICGTCIETCSTLVRGERTIE
jgi:ClpX C4-type zinc finger